MGNVVDTVLSLSNKPVGLFSISQQRTHIRENKIFKSGKKKTVLTFPDVYHTIKHHYKKLFDTLKRLMGNRAPSRIWTMYPGPFPGEFERLSKFGN